MRNQKISQWAQRMIRQNAIVLDTETTGLYPGKIVDIALLDLQTGRVLFESLLNPEMPIPPDATAIHGITDEMVSNAPVFANVAFVIKKLLREHTCVIFNVDFDTHFLHAEGIDTSQYHFEDAMGWAKRVYGARRFNLQYACQREGIDTGRAHRARNDAMATRNLVAAWANQNAEELFFPSSKIT